VTWFGILKALVLAIMGVADWLRNRKLSADASAGPVASRPGSAPDEVAAENAHESVRVALGRNPERLRDDDGFRRPD
jgi:hypothetical protein